MYLFTDFKEWLSFQITPVRMALKYFWVLGVTHRHVLQVKDNGAMTYCKTCNNGFLDPYDHVMAPCAALQELRFQDVAVKLLQLKD